MKLYFSEEQKAKELHKIYLEEDDLTLEAEYAEGDGKQFTLSGIATIEGERYHEFEVVFELEKEVEQDLEQIMSTDWDWYDFNF
ncbi:hypothetical protein [Chakrabartyella piscis]|uniref:hypothetical protein n=1 Tax=Chakrabartyella piscis TaxID=2918914 RepID=UPI00295847FF|nr:hypothetical protein [Chakrabartyella piscis]